LFAFNEWKIPINILFFIKSQFGSLFKLQTPPSGYPGVMDDLIFSGAGSGCRGDDEDECMPPLEGGSGDDLITPVYVPPTKQTITSTKSKTNESGKECDDEDCKTVDGSGSGETTDSMSTTSLVTKIEEKGLLISSYFLLLK
jgi:hypothetical protein